MKVERRQRYFDVAKAISARDVNYNEEEARAARRCAAGIGARPGEKLK